MKQRAVRSVLVVVVLFVSGTAGGFAVPAAARAGAGRVSVLGTVPAAVAGARPMGPVGGSRRLSLQVDLPLRHFVGLEAAIAGLSDPASPGYQRFLTAAQLTARYGPTAAQLGTVESYLRSAGIAVTSVSPQRNMIDASATVRAADRAFGVRIWWWHGVGGRIFYSPGSDPVLPAAVARLVLAVSGLDDAGRLQPDAVTCTTAPRGGPPSGICAEPEGLGNNLGYRPGQLQKAYGLARLAGSGLCGPQARCDGAGQRVGILELASSWDKPDEAQFDSAYGLSASPATAVCPKHVSPCPIQEGSLGEVHEADLDVEAVHAIAPGAGVVVYETPENLISALGDLLTTMLNEKTITTTNSISYGTCEKDVGSSQAQAMDQKFALLAMRGEVFFVSSGDHGKYCHNRSKDVMGPQYPASDPLVTAVGGTNLLLNADNSYAYEYAWSESGGGSSTYPWNTRPAWQTGPGIPVGPRRLVPDVSAEAFCSLSSCRGSQGYDYDITGPGTSYRNAAMGFSQRTLCTATTHCWKSEGGTSLASPLWAGVAAVYNQYATWAGKLPLDADVSGQLYGLAFRRHRYTGAITDITYKAESGTDLRDNAGKGWDYPTGAGSPQAYTMVSDLPGLAIKPGAGPPGTTVVVTGSAFLPGEMVTATDVTSSSATICSGTATADGSFRCTGKIPGTAAYTAQQIVATGKTSAGQAATVFDIVAGTHDAYVTNNADGTVTPVNTATNTAGTPIPVGGHPNLIAITPNGATAYVTIGDSGTVIPVDTATGTPGTPIPAGSYPDGIAITPNGATAYVTDYHGFTVIPVNTATNTAGTPIPAGSYPAGIAITPNGAMAYVANYAASGTVTPVDLATGTAGTPIPVGSYPFGIAITPNGATGYVANEVSGTITPVNLATGTPGTPIPVGTQPVAIAITPNGTTAYVANYAASGTVTPVNLATGTTGTPIPVGAYPAAVAITPNGTTAYVASQRSNTVTPINLATNTARTPIPVGTAPTGIATTYNGGGF